MAIIFAEPWETGIIGTPAVPGTLAISSSITAGSWSAYSARLASSSPATYVLPATYTTLYGQTRVYADDASGWDQNEAIIRFQSPNGTDNVTIGTDSSGRLVARRGGPTGTILGSPTYGPTLAAYVWYYLSFKVVISDSVGEVVVKLDGATVLNLTSQDTRNDGTAGGDTIDRIQLSYSGVVKCWDDLILNDTTDTDNVSYPDNLGIEALMPNGAGDNTGLTASAGSNYACVDERPPNDVTDYVYDSVINDYDLYNLPATSFSTVAAVALALRASKSDAGAASIAPMLKVDTDASGTADTENTGSDIALSTSWVTYVPIYNRQPGPSSWSSAKVDALQAGVKAR